MKRRNKCANKKGYYYKDTALRVAEKAWWRDGTELAIYECPVCLDFHLTSKWCNTSHLHKHWFKKKVKEVGVLENRINKKLQREKQIAEVIQRKKYYKEKKSNSKTVPNEVWEQLRKSNLDPMRLSPSSNFWSRFWSIIKCEGKWTGRP